MKFTTRDIGWVVLTVGLLLGWYLDRRLTIEMFDNLIITHYNFKHIGGSVPYGSYVPLSADRTGFQLESEREAEAWLSSLQIDVHLESDDWIAEIPTAPGIMARGKSRDEAAQRVRMLAALVLLNGRRVYFPSQMSASSDELFPEIELP